MDNSAKHTLYEELKSMGIEEQPCNISNWSGSHAAGFSLQRFQSPRGSAEGGTNP